MNYLLQNTKKQKCVTLFSPEILIHYFAWLPCQIYRNFWYVIEALRKLLTLNSINARFIVPILCGMVHFFKTLFLSLTYPY